MQEFKTTNKLKLSIISQASNRFDDMMKSMVDLSKEKTVDLNSDERNLIYIAFKHIIIFRRNSLKTISNIEKKNENPDLNEYLIEYRKKLVEELIDVICNIIQIINKQLLPKAKDTEAKVFYKKLMGDFYRYIAENLDNSERMKYVELSFKCYDEASKLSSKLEPFNPIRLGLSLNFSVFYYEIQKDKLTANKIANEALTLVKKHLDEIDFEEEIYQDSLDIIKLIEENLILWKDGKQRKTSLLTFK